MSVEEEEIALPADTLRVLNEFLQEKAAQEAVECQGSRSDILFAENWVFPLLFLFINILFCIYHIKSTFPYFYFLAIKSVLV